MKTKVIIECDMDEVDEILAALDDKKAPSLPSAQSDEDVRRLVLAAQDLAILRKIPQESVRAGHWGAAWENLDAALAAVNRT